MKFLEQIQFELESLNGVENQHRVSDFLNLNDSKNALIVLEGSSGEDAEVAVFLEKRLVEEFQAAEFPQDFDFNMLPKLSVIIEELSHFNFFCEKAGQDEALTALEMEVQAEVDKFALALRWLESQNEESLRHRVFEQVFENYRYGSWVSGEERIRYEEAHLIAKNFCRRFIKEDLSPESFREFFALSRAEKLGTRY